jgi:hypothetical protein
MPKGKPKKEELSAISHLQILNNTKADFHGRVTTYLLYLDIGYEDDKALAMAGLTKNLIEQNKLLFEEIKNNINNG